jgi:hypothetical protein
MAYGRQTIMDGLRKAGQAFNDFDERYANAVKERIQGDDSSGMRGFAADFAGGRVGDVEVDEEVFKQVPRYMQAGARAYQYGVPIAGYATRYVAPAAGVTLAGKGLIDIANSFGGPADEPQPNELRLE